MKNPIVKTAYIKQIGEVKDHIGSYSCAEISDGVLAQELSVDFSLKAVEPDIFFSGEIKGFLSLQCCRCLNGFKFPVDIGISQVYPLNIEEINLEDEIRQSLILNIPLKPLCGKDCKGLCPQCGRNLNTGLCGCTVRETDPRWDTLRKLIK